MRAATYNPMSAYGDRLQMISREMKNFHFVGLPGTQKKETVDRVTSTERRHNKWEFCKTPGHHALQFGFPAQCSTHSTGVTVLFSAKMFSVFNVQDVQWPEDQSIQGRACFVRIVSGRVDYALLVLYFPVRKDAKRGAADKLVDWANRMLQERVPARCTPLVFCDLNDRLGIQVVSAGEWAHSSTYGSTVGSFAPEKEGYSSSMFREVASRHHLCFANTHYKAGPTFFAEHGARSRIDFLLVPNGLMQHIVSCSTLIGLAKKFQKPSVARLLDHVPLQVTWNLFFAVATARALRGTWTKLWKQLSKGTGRNVINLCQRCRRPFMQGWMNGIIWGAPQTCAGSF